VTSLEVPLGKSAVMLEHLAATCDSGQGYEQQLLWIRRKLRQVSVPDNYLDVVHRRINSLLFPLDLAMGREINGFVARRSTHTNALPHVGAKYLQKFDIKEFFANIRTAQVRTALHEAGFGADAAAMLSRLVSCDGQIPLGAKTSPRISNLVLMPFDDAMIELAAERGLAYTRYADDLSFSAKDQFDVRLEVEAALTSNGFELNPEKTKAFKFGQPMFVTGLAISDPLKPRLRKRFKAKLRSEFYFVEKFGLAEHADTIGVEQRRAASRMMGQFHYARSIEPEFAARLEAKYPAAFHVLIPQRSDDRIERSQRSRREFLIQVSNAPELRLPFYTPTISLPGL
jgi:hypothetical protein